MPDKKLIQTELMKEIISIRLDTLWKMLAMKKEGVLPEPYEEGATGKLDNKGGIFIPGGVIHQDVDEVPIRYDSQKNVGPHIPEADPQGNAVRQCHPVVP